MNKGGIGVGSASIMLMFAVLCLTVFALISFASASTDKAMTDEEALMVKGYYDADTLAERILSVILEADVIPDKILGADIITYDDTQTGVKTVEFSCPISEDRELYVKVSIYQDSYDILQWCMQNVDEWEIDEGLPVWPGE